jgi:CRISPR-associated protein Cas5h
MEAIKFNLSGMGATFKRPYINTVQLTYTHIHKIALLGILGSVLGLGGYNTNEYDVPSKNKKPRKYPEFYEKLNMLKISIIPEGNGYIRQSKKNFTDTTGFSNNGDTLIVKEKFLIEPKWAIYIQKGTTDIEVYEKLKQYLLTRQSVFEPYLGRNHYPASITEVELVELVEESDPYNIDSLFMARDFKFVDFEFTYIENEFIFSEFAPVRLTPFLNYYDTEVEFILTNKPVEYIGEGTNVFFDDKNNKFLYFY